MTHEGTREDERPSLVAGMAMILALGNGLAWHLRSLMTAY
jgi:hypothetical protein